MVVAVLSGVVLYGVGSPVIVDVEESLWRSKVPLIAGIQNVANVSHLSDPTILVSLGDCREALFAQPFLVPLFTPQNRETAAVEAAKVGFRHAGRLIDPSVLVPRIFFAEDGIYVNSGCTLGSHTRFGAFVFVNRGCCIGHHVVLEAFVSVGPGAVIAGGVYVGRGALIGAGAVILPEIRIGRDAVIGAGAVVTKDVPEHATVLGNPARIVSHQ